MIRWYFYILAISAAGLWPVDHFLNPGLDKPLIFITFYITIFLIIWLLSFFVNRKYFFRLPKIISFILFFIKESIGSNMRIAYEILTPGLTINPAIISVPIDLKTDFELVTLASLITLTPGTISLEVSDDRKTLYIHEMFIKGRDIESSRQNIKNGFEKRIIELLK